jgi:signal transduction histidine kinase
MDMAEKLAHPVGVPLPGDGGGEGSRASAEPLRAPPAQAPTGPDFVRRTAGRFWRVAPLFFIAYLLADFVTGLFPHPRFGVQPWNLQPALAVALVAIGGRAYLPLVVLAVLAGGATVPQMQAGPAWLLGGIGVGASLWCGGMVLRRWTAWGGMAIGLADVGILLAASLGTAFLCALFEAARQIGAPGMVAANYALLAWRVFVADLLGIVVWAPLLLLGLGGGLRIAASGARVPAALRDVLLFAGVLAGLLLIVFGYQPLDEFRLSYLLFLPMIAVVMRHGLAGAVVALPVVQLGLLGALATVGIRPGTAFEFQMLMLTLAASSLTLGALNDERRRATDRITQHERSLRERSRALAEAQRIASTAELAAALAHDLAQPLSAIGTYARASRMLAERGEVQHAQLLETLQEIGAETARAGQYLHRMREFFRTGQMRAERVEVASLFDSAHAHMRDRLLLAQVGWRATVERGVPPVRVDAVQIGAVLGNLVANACDAMSEDVAWREVRLRASQAQEAGRPVVRICVEDTGPGVPEAIRGQLFKPLATSKPNGMGLGLALSRSIAERQGGRLWFEPSRELTTFCLELPCDESDAILPE